MKGKAQVTKHTGSHYLLEDMEGGELFPAVLRGRMRLKDANATNPVAVGDIVDYEYEDSPSAENPAAIVLIHPRRNYIIRKSTNLSRKNHIIAASTRRSSSALSTSRSSNSPSWTGYCLPARHIRFRQS